MPRWTQSRQTILSSADVLRRLTGFTGSALFFGTSGLGGTTLLKLLERELPAARYHRAWSTSSTRQELPQPWRHRIVLLDDFEIGKRPGGPASPIVPFPNLPSQCFGFTSGYSLRHAHSAWRDVITGSPNLIFQLRTSDRFIERPLNEVGRLTDA